MVHAAIGEGRGDADRQLDVAHAFLRAESTCQAEYILDTFLLQSRTLPAAEGEPRGASP